MDLPGYVSTKRSAYVNVHDYDNRNEAFPLVMCYNVREELMKPDKS